MPGLDVFAVEDRAVQVAWSSLPSPELVLEIGDQRVVVGTEPPAWYRQARDRPVPAGRSGPGAVTVAGLEPDTDYDVCLRGARMPGRRVAVAHTLPPPPGRRLARFATISDCHFGDRRVGPLRRLHDPLPRPVGLARYPERCAAAAIGAAAEWGAELVLAKGDLTEHSWPDEIYTAAEMFRTAPMPVELVLGNHDVRGPLDVAAVFSSAGLPTTVEPRALDLPGARLVLGHSPLPDRHGGAIPAGDIDVLAGLAGGTAPGAGTVVVLHHPPRRFTVETKYPPSIGGQDSVRLVRALAEANPATCILAGHTHRNRRYQVGRLTVGEVASTKDYPGVWGGYTIYEGGIRQVVFRVAEPTAIAWTETTKRALGGLWGWWSPGRLEDRCWTLCW